MTFSRRDFVKSSVFTVGALATSSLPTLVRAAERPKVYFSRELSAESLIRLYGMVNKDIGGKIAVKLHTGEPDGPNILPREWVRAFLAQLPNATFDYEDSKKTDCMWFGVQADYATRAFYVTTEMPAGMDPWLLLDADDSSQVGVGKEWKGFTTGEVWLEFVFDGSGNSGILVKEIAGQNLSGEKIADTTAPSVITDFALDNDMPVGIVGQAYPIPAPAKILDGVEGILSSSAAEIRLYKTEGILSFDCSDLIENGAFVPKEAGTYRIRYILTDSSGNEGLRDLLVEISSEQQEITVGCALPQPSRCANIISTAKN